MASAHRVSAVGHAHIDSAWLWPLRETVRKVARTASNVLALMDDDPDFVFAMSSAQQWAWMEEHRPDVWERMRKKVADGRLLPVGGMWVESDTNMPGGEALARQFVHGKRFFLDKLGVETEEVWLPDSFGYTAALPQLVRLSRSRWFLTQKISWSHFNRFPHHTFWWEGIDGSRVFTHFPPVDTYNAELSGASWPTWCATSPTRGSRTARWSRSATATAAADRPARCWPARRACAISRDRRGWRSSRPPGSSRRRSRTTRSPRSGSASSTWRPHRGTYTSQAENKQGNRRSEHLLYEAELWSATAAVRAGHPYPYEELDRIWKTVLLHQFHDILPGSSIAWVHRESRETYERVPAELEAIIGSAQRALAGDGASGGEVVFNAAPHARDGVPARGAAPVAAPTRAGHLHGNRRRARPRQRAGPGHRRRARSAGVRDRPGLRPGRRSPPVRRATCCSSTRTCRPSTTPGTSTTPTGARSPT